MAGPTTPQAWGLAAILGTGLCCGGLLGNIAWLGATGLSVAGLASGMVWMALAGLAAAGVALAVVLRRRRACAVPETSR